jgi:hypothetical protein
MAVLPFNPFVDTSVKFFTGTDRRLPPVITLPSVTSFKVQRSAEKTDVPIEQGSDISIHRRKAPVSIMLSGIVTEVEPFDGVPVLTSQVVEIRSALELIYDLGIMVKVRFNGRTFRNMTIDTFPDSQEATERIDVWHFDLTMSETKIASTTTVLSGSSPFGSLTSTTLEGGPQAGQAIGPEAAAQVGGILGGGV